MGIIPALMIYVIGWWLSWLTLLASPTLSRRKVVLATLAGWLVLLIAWGAVVPGSVLTRFAGWTERLLFDY